MKAIITTYKPGKYNETRKPDVMIKSMGEYTEFILRAGNPQYNYQSVTDENSGIVYLISDKKALNCFEIRFE